MSSFNIIISVYVIFGFIINNKNNKNNNSKINDNNNNNDNNNDNNMNNNTVGVCRDENGYYL